MRLKVGRKSTVIHLSKGKISYVQNVLSPAIAQSDCSIKYSTNNVEIKGPKGKVAALAKCIQRIRKVVIPAHTGIGSLFRTAKINCLVTDAVKDQHGCSLPFVQLVENNWVVCFMVDNTTIPLTKEEVLKAINDLFETIVIPLPPKFDDTSNCHLDLKNVLEDNHAVSVSIDSPNRITIQGLKEQAHIVHVKIEHILQQNGSYLHDQILKDKKQQSDIDLVSINSPLPTEGAARPSAARPEPADWIIDNVNTENCKPLTKLQLSAIHQICFNLGVDKGIDYPSIILKGDSAAVTKAKNAILDLFLNSVYECTYQPLSIFTRPPCQPESSHVRRFINALIADERDFDITMADNASLWGTYMTNLDILQAKKEMGWDIVPVQGLRGQAEISTNFHSYFNLNGSLSKELNECILFYRTDKEKANKIIKTGLDVRVSKNCGSGRGITFYEYTDTGDRPAPRLCIIKIWPTFKGYGFNLRAEKGKAGQFIGPVDADSPSEKAGLKEGDKIIEVNGKNISQDTHAQVVQKIKETPNRAEMLVLDAEGVAYYTNKGVVVSSSMANVIRTECPDTQDGAPTTVTAMTNGGTPSGEGPKLRLCHVRKWPDFQGYGFNLHTEKGKAGQFIGNVDDDSPADAAGLKKGDKLVAVNDQGVINDDHGGVVSKIKSVPDETRLLVADPDTEGYYTSRGMSLADKSIGVITIVCPTSRQAPKLRMCHVRRWADFQGYGFNLHTEKGKSGKFIGQVDNGGPAEAAGLKSGDKLVAVNGKSVLSDDHAEVVNKIKENPSETRLLVADEATLNYYTSKGITLSPDMDNYELIECPASRQVNGVQVEAEVNGSEKSEEEDEMTNDNEEPPEYNDEAIPAPAEPQKVDEPEPVAQESVPVVEAEPVVQESEPVVEAEPVVQESEPVVEAEPVVQEAEPVVQESEPEPKAEESYATEAAAAAATIEESIKNEEIAEEAKPDYNEYEEPPREQEPERVPTPEPQRAPTPEPIREPSPEPQRAPTPEPVRAPTPEPQRAPTPEPAREPTPPPAPPKEEGYADNIRNSDYDPMYETVTYKEEPKIQAAPQPVEPPKPKGPVVVGGIEFAGSVAEARARASKKEKKQAGINAQLSVKEKYDMFQRL